MGWEVKMRSEDIQMVAKLQLIKLAPPPMESISSPVPPNQNVLVSLTLNSLTLKHKIRPRTSSEVAGSMMPPLPLRACPQNHHLHGPKVRRRAWPHCCSSA